MKKSLRILTFITLLISSTLAVRAQEEVNPLSDAFRHGNATAISEYFNDNIEMVVPKTDNFFTKQQARTILSDFFRHNPVKEFTVIHKGNKENSAFTIGKLTTTTGNYRVSFYARKVPDTKHKLIYQLRIEEEK